MSINQWERISRKPKSNPITIFVAWTHPLFSWPPATDELVQWRRSQPSLFGCQTFLVACLCSSFLISLVIRECFMNCATRRSCGDPVGETLFTLDLSIVLHALKWASLQFFPDSFVERWRFSCILIMVRICRSSLQQLEPVICRISSGKELILSRFNSKFFSSYSFLSALRSTQFQLSMQPLITISGFESTMVTWFCSPPLFFLPALRFLLIQMSAAGLFTVSFLFQSVVDGWEVLWLFDSLNSHFLWLIV